ncbi:MAG: FAD-dependent oxidoreductase [Candidatus Dormibacteria bacterium]
MTRSGVFLCECGGNISGVLDLPALAARGRALDGVVNVAVCQFLCGTEGRRVIEGVVASRGLDRIVIGACSRRFQGPTFERIARDLELGDNTVAFANLREGCAFVHRREPERAQAKAETILAAAVARAARQRPLQPSRTFLHRSALVVGGGIGGLSTAEELAAAGIEVHLVEREQSLGGYMARLAKTFPTEDCAMCSLGPRLANAATDPRIHVDTLSEVISVSGPPGEFRVRVRHRPRFVSDQCVGCGACAAACPVELESEYDLGVTTRKAISRPFANAVPPTFAIDHRGWAPCTSTCPAHTSAQGYIALAAQGRWSDAYRVASAPNPFPSVCGRICPHACEDECTRGRLDEPVAIAGIKRFVADQVGAAAPVQPPELRFEERVAVVGAGPAGLTAARDLALLGYAVTVFEAQPCAGGMLRLGLPEFRLPRDVVGSEVERVLAHGVALRCGQRCGRDYTVDSLLGSGYRAVLLALGLQRPRTLPLDGAGLPGVVTGVGLLRARALGETVGVGPRVVVIGGGDVAVDAARTALRLGATRVTMACIEGRDTLPAQPGELAEALEEGVELLPSLMPVALLGEGGVTAVRLQPCALGEADERGWRPPLPAAGDPVVLEADTVVLCVGQALEEAALEGAGGVVVANGQIAVDGATMMTARPGVFAAGDAAPSGGLIAIQAIAAGARAARAIHNHLRGARLAEVWPAERDRAEVSEVELSRRPTVPRRRMRALLPEERRLGWQEVRAGFTEEEALAEARRCLSCGGCAECGSCAAACPAGAIDLTQQPWEEELTVGAIVIATGHQEFDARRKPPLGYGRYANVLTQSQLARLLSASGPTEGELRRPSDGQVPRRVFMLQCVGSRDSTSRGNSHCSAICCLFATLHASLIRESYPDTQVTVAYTDLRMPGKAHEEYLKLVIERGVRYVRSRVGEIAEEPDKSLRVRWEDTITGRKTEELFDLVVLSAGLEASAGTTQIARVAGLQQGAAGFLREYHPKLRPVDSQRSGIFIAGTAQGPKGIPETIAQAKAAAARVTSMLQGGMAVTPVEVAHSDPGVCIGCAVCVSVCPQGAVRLLDGDRPHAVVDQASCRGCGICAAECPSGAMTVGGFSDAELLAEVMA